MQVKITRIVDIKDLTIEDMKLLNRDDLEKIAVELIKPSKSLDQVKTSVTPSKAVVANPEATVKTLKTRSNPRLSSFISVGVKVGKSSKYSYVYWNTASKSYKITHGNKKSYKSEIEAALASDKYLDDKDNKTKPRNRDNFIEIMEAYNNLHCTPAVNDYVTENDIQ